jgi:hypothetical protein
MLALMDRLHALATAFLLAAAPVDAATYGVGPGAQFPTLQAAFDAVDLGPGDVVEVTGGVTYDVGMPGIIMRDADSGAPGNPVVLRGIRVGGQRPVLRGGFNTIEFRSSNHVVFEGFEVTGTGDMLGGTFRCIYHHAHEITIRDVLVRDCPRHGILGADTDSGSLTVEHSEIRNAGSNQGNHAIYMATDEIAYPGAVFRLRHSHLHDSRFDDTRDGGNLVKSRAERNEIHYNWLEGAFFHELELIGPDPCCAQPGWSDATAREDSDVVGNVIVHTSAFSAVLRLGGDGTSGGRGESFGRYRFVNNTIVRIHPNNDTPTVFRLFEGIESLEFHNNVIWRDGPSGVNLVRALEAQWTDGPRVRGSNNWIESGFTLNPANLPVLLSGTITGGNPGFTNLATFDLSPAADSPLLDAGTTATVTAPDYDLANPLFPPLFHPPPRAVQGTAGAAARPAAPPIDIGAFERGTTGSVFADGFEPAQRQAAASAAIDLRSGLEPVREQRRLRRAGTIQHQDLAAVDHVEVARLILAERGHHVAQVDERRAGGAPAGAGLGRGPDLAGAVVGVEVRAAHALHRAAVAEAAGDRAAPGGMVVVDDRRGRLHDRGGARRTGVEIVVALEAAPAVVAAADADGLEAHFLDVALADVADQHVASLAVERPAPRIAQPVGPDLVAGLGDRTAAHAGLPGGDRVLHRLPGARLAAHAPAGDRGAAVDVDAQHLAQQGARSRVASVGGERRIRRARAIVAVGGGQPRRVERLRAVARIATAAAVAETDVQEAVGTEGDVAAVMVGEVLVHPQDHGAGREVRRRQQVVARGRRRRDGLGVAQDHGVAGAVGDADEDAAVALVLRVEGEAEQAALATRREPDGAGRRVAGIGARGAAAETHEGVRLQRAGPPDADLAALLDHEQAVAAIGGVEHADRAAEAGGDEGRELRGGGLGHRQRRGGDAQDGEREATDGVPRGHDGTPLGHGDGQWYAGPGSTGVTPVAPRRPPGRRRRCVRDRSRWRTAPRPGSR